MPFDFPETAFHDEARAGCAALLPGGPACWQRNLPAALHACSINSLLKMNFTRIQLPSPAEMLIVGFVCALMFLLPPSAFADEVVLQDGQLLAAFDTDSGALVRLENGATPWVTERTPELSLPF